LISSDVQNRRMTNSFKLTRVGITGVKKPVNIQRPGRVVTLTINMDAFVDLPSTQKGSHMALIYADPC
jgi:GTP cyclohydrolase-4